jgi:hypothetical protein
MCPGVVMSVSSGSLTKWLLRSKRRGTRRLKVNPEIGLVLD